MSLQALKIDCLTVNLSHLEEFDDS
jgi:hypothetical protein